MGLVKHMRLTKDVITKERADGSKYALGTAVYDLYLGKDKTVPVFVNIAANSEREVNFLDRFGKKGSVLNFSGEISVGKPYQNKKTEEWISTVNLNVELVKFPDVRMGQSTQGTSNSSSSTASKPAADSSTKETPGKSEVEETEDIFDAFWGGEDETA